MTISVVLGLVNRFGASRAQEGRFKANAVLVVRAGNPPSEGGSYEISGSPRLGCASGTRPATKSATPVSHAFARQVWRYRT